jgi:PRC-barrel domain
LAERWDDSGSEGAAVRIVRLMIIAASLMTTDQFRWVSWSSVVYADQPLVVSKGSSSIGKSVKTQEGQDLGTMVNNGRGGGDIEYAVLSSGGSLGIKYVAVPWSVLTLSGDKSHFVLSAKEAWMRKTRDLDKPSWLDISQPDWTVVVYDVNDLRRKTSHKTMPLSRSTLTLSVVTEETRSWTGRPPS